MQDIDQNLLKRIVEGAIMAAGRPLSLDQLQLIFVEDEERDEKPGKDVLRAALQDLQSDCRGRGYELKEVASGWRFQVVEEVGPWVSRLWEEKPQKYSRALLETLALIAYRQPITRGDIEDVRGVTVSSSIIKTLMEREWIKVVGHRDVPGRPALYATTRHFLDYFNLKSLEHLPTLAELRDFGESNEGMEFADSSGEAANEESASSADDASPAENEHIPEGAIAASHMQHEEQASENIESTEALSVTGQPDANEMPPTEQDVLTESEPPVDDSDSEDDSPPDSLGAAFSESEYQDTADEDTAVSPSHAENR